MWSKLLLGLGLALLVGTGWLMFRLLIFQLTLD